jgi:hypothetical protein
MLTGIGPSDLSAIERELRPVYAGYRRRISHAFRLPEQKLFAKDKDEAA